MSPGRLTPWRKADDAAKHKHLEEDSDQEALTTGAAAEPESPEVREILPPQVLAAPTASAGTQEVAASMPAPGPDATAPDSAGVTATSPDSPGVDGSAVRRLVASLHPRWRRGQLLVAVLCGVLGFGVATQVRLGQDDILSQARRSDLVQILDGLTQQNDRLQDQLVDLESQRRELASGADAGQSALQAARQRALTLGVLAGTEPATGSGIVVRINDPKGGVGPEIMLGAVEELRDAGAEAIQIADADNSVRVVQSTWFDSADNGAVVVSGQTLRAPYTITVVGDSNVLAGAMSFPTGVTSQVEGVGGSTRVQPSPKVTVTAVRGAQRPSYASPVPDAK